MNTSSKRIIISSIVFIIALIVLYFTQTQLEAPSANTNTASSSTLAVGKPIITKLDLPQAINVDQVASWTIHASSTDGLDLKYSVLWGDEVVTDPDKTVKPVKVSSNTFTHAYNYPGVFNPVFTIYGSNGQSVYASVGARVLGESKKAPILYSLSPSAVIAGDLVYVTGAGFTPPKQVPNGPGTMPTNEVIFDGQSVPGVTYNGINSLYFIVPNDTKNGKHTVQVKNSNGPSNTISLIVKK